MRETKVEFNSNPSEPIRGSRGLHGFKYKSPHKLPTGYTGKYFYTIPPNVLAAYEGLLTPSEKKQILAEKAQQHGTQQPLSGDPAGADSGPNGGPQKAYWALPDDDDLLA